ncbi:MAG: hypothetical protein NTW28_13470 [Candidatus Solibacter sp.]|nr:hypothetical protein [Candidatus Solibacter sp.]
MPNCHLTLMVDAANVPTLVLDANATASAGNNDMVHVTSDDAGFYDLELTAVQTNYLGRAMLAITDAANHCPVFHEFMILPAVVYDAMILGTDLFDVSVTQIAGVAVSTTTAQLGTNVVNVGGTAQTARDLGASVVAASVTGVVGAVKKNVALPSFLFPMFDVSGNLKTGLSVTVAIRLDTAAFHNTAAGATEIGTSGWYTVDLGTADTNGNVIAFSATAAGAVPTCMTIITQA